MNKIVESRIAHIPQFKYNCGVYKLIHAPTGKFYVGGSTHIRKRISEHFSDMTTKTDVYKHPEMMSLWDKGVATDWQVEIMLTCSMENIKLYEQIYINALDPYFNKSGSATAGIPKGTKLSEDVCKQRSETTRSLWTDPVYKERASNARLNNTFALGYKCTPEQTENRKRAGRISVMKRKYGVDWKTQYVISYPEHTEDLDSK